MEIKVISFLLMKDILDKPDSNRVHSFMMQNLGVEIKEVLDWISVRHEAGPNRRRARCIVWATPMLSCFTKSVCLCFTWLIMTMLCFFARAADLTESPEPESAPQRVSLLLRNRQWVTGHSLRVDDTELQLQTGDQVWREKRSQVQEVHFHRPAPDPEVVHTLHLEEWETVRQLNPVHAPEFKAGHVIFHDHRFLSQPLPDPLPERFVLHLLVSAPDNQYYFQWRVFQDENHDFARNAFSISLHGRRVTLQGAGPRIGMDPIQRKTWDLPAEREDQQHLAFYFDGDANRCLLYINGLRQAEWTLKGEREIQSTGLRVNDRQESEHKLHLHRVSLEPWERFDPATRPVPDGKGDHIILMNGDVLSGQVQIIESGSITMEVENRNMLNLPEMRVYRIVFK